MKRESFIVYKSFYGLIKLLKAPQRLAMYEAIFNYGFTGEMPEFSDDTSEAIWEAVLPQLKANQKRYENGLRGGAPVGNSNARKNNQETIDNAEEKQPKNNQDGETKNNQSISEKTTEIYSKKQPNENVNENENVNYKKVSKKEEKEINKINNSASARESYEDILDEWEIPEVARYKFFEFIRHRQLMRKSVTNDYLDGLCSELSFKQNCSADEMIKILSDAINGGYADIKRIGE